MKVIIDTNVLISGIFFSGPLYEILKAWRDHKLELIISEEILNEYKLVCDRLSLKYPQIDTTEILDLIIKNAHFFQPIIIDEQITADPDDDKFLTCAISSNVGIIISGDKHLLDSSGYEGIEILAPSQFIQKYL